MTARPRNKEEACRANQPMPLGRCWNTLVSGAAYAQVQGSATALGVHRRPSGAGDRASTCPRAKGWCSNWRACSGSPIGKPGNSWKPAHRPLTSLTSSRFSAIPFSPDAEALLETVARRLSAPPHHGPDARLCVHGLGGIRQDPTGTGVCLWVRAGLRRAVFWINDAKASGQISSSFVAIAEVLQVPERAEAEQQRAVTAVQRWLNRHSGWLLIWITWKTWTCLPRFLPRLLGRVPALLRRGGRGAWNAGEGDEVAPLPARKRCSSCCVGRPCPAGLPHLSRSPGLPKNGRRSTRRQRHWYSGWMGCRSRRPWIRRGHIWKRQAVASSGYLQRYQQQRETSVWRGVEGQGPNTALMATTFALAKARLEQDYQAAGDLC